MSNLPGKPISFWLDSTPKTTKNNLDVGIHWLGDRLKGLQSWSIDDVKPGEGKLINLQGETIGVYKDETGKVTAVSATCPHLACIVNWNSAEMS